MAQGRHPATAFCIGVCIAIALFALWPAKPAAANGSHGDSTEVFWGAAGPYLVRVEAVPIVGDLHLVVYLTEKDDTPLQGAVIEATATGPGDAPPRVGPASNVPQTEYNPSLYSVTLPGATQEGLWNVALRIEPGGEEAEVEVAFPIALEAPGDFNELIIAVLAAFALFLAWMIFSWRRQASRRRS